jgi:arylsulfatase A-like enzyme
LLGLLAGCTQQVPERPDVLLVVLDTVRADRLNAYGAARPTGNQLSAIADAGVLFEDVTASGTWTWPSHAALFTGEPPWVSGAHWSEASDEIDPATGYWRMSPMRTDLPTLAERFSAAGYRTVSLASNSLLDPGLGLTRGFDRAEWLKRDQTVVAEAKALLRNHDPRPLFLFVNLMAAHAPYALSPEVPWSQQHKTRFSGASAEGWVGTYSADRIPPALALNQRPSSEAATGEEAFAKGTLKLDADDLGFIRDLYDGELLRLDRAMVELIGVWNSSGHADGIVAVTSDHGEYLGEHGLIGHGVRAFDEVTHVPLVIAAPTRLKGGRRVATPVQLADLYPTLLDLSGIAPSAPGSLLAVADGEPRVGPILSRAWPMPVFAKNVGGAYTQGHRLFRQGGELAWVRDDGKTRVHTLGPDRRLSPVRDVPAAPWVERARAAMPDGVSTGDLAVPAEALEHLRALGYVQ